MYYMAVYKELSVYVCAYNNRQFWGSPSPPCVVGRHPSSFVMGPAASYGKSPEDMYDEIVQLKKVKCVCVCVCSEWCEHTYIRTYTVS